jgi:hypothetical protein
MFLLIHQVKTLYTDCSQFPPPQTHSLFFSLLLCVTDEGLCTKQLRLPYLLAFIEFGQVESTVGNEKGGEPPFPPIPSPTLFP